MHVSSGLRRHACTSASETSRANFQPRRRNQIGFWTRLVRASLLSFLAAAWWESQRMPQKIFCVPLLHPYPLIRLRMSDTRMRVELPTLIIRMRPVFASRYRLDRLRLESLLAVVMSSAIESGAVSKSRIGSKACFFICHALRMTRITRVRLGPLCHAKN